MSDPTFLAQWSKELTFGGALVAALWFGHKRIWFFGWVLTEAERAWQRERDQLTADRDQLRKERDQYQGYLFHAFGIVADTLPHLAQQQARRNEGPKP